MSPLDLLDAVIAASTKFSGAITAVRGAQSDVDAKQTALDEATARVAAAQNLLTERPDAAVAARQELDAACGSAQVVLPPGPNSAVKAGSN